MMIDNELSSSKSAEHYTPIDYVEAARTVMGGIDCDPASCVAANDVIKAKTIYTIDNSGLLDENIWRGRVIVNAPGSCKDDATGEYTGCGTTLTTGPRQGGRRTSCACRLPQRFWAKLGQSVDDGLVSQFVWIGFNISHLRILQGVGALLLKDCMRFVPEFRMRFTGQSPTKDNVVLYYGPRRCAFVDAFDPLHGDFSIGVLR